MSPPPSISDETQVMAFTHMPPPPLPTHTLSEVTMSLFTRVWETVQDFAVDLWTGLGEKEEGGAEVGSNKDAGKPTCTTISPCSGVKPLLPSARVMYM